MAIVYKILEKLKDNENLEVALKNIRATAFANILLSCMEILEMTFLENSEWISLDDINLKSVVLTIVLVITMKKVKVKLNPIIYILFSGFIGVIIKITI